jgi:hypothetical protein
MKSEKHVGKHVGKHATGQAEQVLTWFAQLPEEQQLIMGHFILAISKLPARRRRAVITQAIAVLEAVRFPGAWYSWLRDLTADLTAELKAQCLGEEDQP